MKVILINNNGSKYSPFIEYENYFIGMIIKLSHYHYSITPTERLQSMNSLTKKNDIKNLLKEWKDKNYTIDVLILDTRITLRVDKLTEYYLKIKRLPLIATNRLCAQTSNSFKIK